MLLLLHALISCLAACNYAIVSLIFWHCRPYILQTFFFLFHYLYSCLQIQCSLQCGPHPFCCSWSCEMRVINNEEMAFNCREVLVYCSFTCQEGPYKDFVGNNKPFRTKIKVNTYLYINFVLGCLMKKEEKSEFYQFHVYHCNGVFTTFESVIEHS